MTLLRYERTREGAQFRRFYDLALSRSHTPVFALTFTVMHPILPGSPLHGATAESLAAEEAELLISVTGLEETTSQTVHARHSYLPAEVLFGQRFADIFTTDPDGTRVIDYHRFHETEPAFFPRDGAGVGPAPFPQSGAGVGGRQSAASASALRAWI